MSGYPPPGGGYPPEQQYSYPPQPQEQYTSVYPPQQPYPPPISEAVSQPLLVQQNPSVSFNVGSEPGPETTYHYGSAPIRQPRRYKTTKRVDLFDGNLVLDCPVPSKLLQMVPKKEDREFSHLRYTACTCDPNNFKSEKYTLRQRLYDPPRQTELFIVLTMYNVSKF